MIDAATLDGSADLLRDAEWELALTPAGLASAPRELSGETGWIAAQVPGTAAEALERAGRFDRDAPLPLHDQDVWYRARLPVPANGPCRLVAEGLATICEAWLDNEPLLISSSMYARQEIAIDLERAEEIHLCFRALRPHLKMPGPRARWKTKLVNEPGLRLVRTTFLGHMPGWCPEVHAVGPWRPLHLVPESAVRLEDLSVTATLDAEGTGHLTVRLVPGPDLAGAKGLRITCAGHEADLSKAGDEDGLEAHLTLPGVAPWWPHTHGTPALHEVRLAGDGIDLSLCRTGFRRIEVDHGPDGAGFSLRINGSPVFCRGAVWTSADIVSLPGTRDAYAPWLTLARDANMNMLRIGGTMAPEARAFFELCDELGLLVWQDLPFANLDYPASDPDFAEAVRRETREILAGTSFCPSLAIICGGSEMHQQGAMMGLPESRWNGPLTREILPEAAASVRPDVPYVPNSPSGEGLPFLPGNGIAHYYGVGAYRRPLEDTRRANVRFAGECLAFSNVPETGAPMGPEGAPCHHPDWKRGVPRDRDVGWDFEDVRDHYVRDLYRVDPLDLRYGDPASYLDHGRAAVAEVMEATFAEWRRPASSCAGALVWTFQDLMPGAGWGIVSCDGTPKSALYALKRAFAPLRISTTDEGTNGLAVHVANDGPAPRRVKLALRCLARNGMAVASGEHVLDMAPHGSRSLWATDLIGAFFDVTHAYRFGPASHDCVHVAMLDAETGERLDEAFHFPLGRSRAMSPADLSVTPERDEAGHTVLRIAADRVAQSVAIDAPGYLPQDNWFHLAPGCERLVRLVAREEMPASAGPSGSVRALNAAPTGFSAG
ncbi:MAG: beta-mannosidase [Stappia sp.]|uniref:glycoside hydrolase family 2 protein n=1 Tax=Stappia sp. TaxID=1870903 RepID=UPI000C452101|nr:glycoside hydrolase family 2 protein [Stappia sp.]MAB01162.1 beta-mannosidase [Stappia sp.]MBM19834.1 beta-mannosidase [Stappia sp.]